MSRLAAFLLLALLSLSRPLVCAAAPQSHAPVEDLAAQRMPVSPLTGPWLFHTGDDPTWARSGFDDSTWRQVDPTARWSTQDNVAKTEFAWLRLHLLVPRNTPSLVIQVPGISWNYQLFANGSVIGQAGDMPPARAYPIDAASRVFTAPVPLSSSPQQLTLALRLWQPASSASIRTPSFRSPIYAGTPSAVLRQFRLIKASLLLADGGSYTVSLVGLIVGAAALVLFWLNRSQRFYLWLAFFVVLLGLDLPIGYIARHFAFNYYTVINLYVVVDFLETVVSVFLVLDLLRMPRSRALLPILLMFCAELGVMLITLGHMQSLPANGTYFFFSTAPQVIIIAWLIRGARAGSVDARLLLLPYCIGVVPSIIDNLGHFLVDLKVPHADGLTLIKYVLIQTPFSVDMEQVASIASVLGMLAVLIYHFARTSKDRERLASALSAAHEVQYQLVPSNIPALGGFSTEVAYMAAEEVGGDFCQVLPRPDGSILIAIGDVSGKGLRAAMLGTLCVGALRSLADDTIGPGAALDRLNKAVMRTEYGGFTTCLCAHLSPEGTITFANAGHLSPYLNGVEIPLNSGLPLGIVAEAEYTEFTVRLPEGARVTLLSDGVVEARSISGELYGFERTSRISRSTASQIAAEAQQYGPQHDDITVLTLDWKSPVLASFAA